MRKFEFEYIAALCDSILHDPKTSIAKFCISSLHVLNSHPVNLGGYELALKDKCLKHNYAIRSIVKLLILKLTGLKSNQSVISPYGLKKIDVLFISHIIKKEDIGSDFYFGDSPEQLKEYGISSAVLLHDHTKKITNIDGLWEKDKTPRIFFKRSLKITEEIRIRVKLWIAGREIGKLGQNSESKLSRSIYKYLQSESLKATSIENYRIFLQVKNIVEKINPKVIITTFEGHAWERLAFAGARKSKSNIFCIGYHHTILFPVNHSIKRYVNQLYEPNIIFTVGDITKKILSEQRDIKNIEVIGALKKINIDIDFCKELNNQDRNACLVIPDGTKLECINIMKFIYKTAKEYSEQVFIIRFHPIISFEEIIKSSNDFKEKPQNIILSALSLEADIKRCRWVLYRGSSAVINAVSFGLRPFYYDQYNELSIDPLFQLFQWKICIFNGSDLIKYINQDLRSDIQKLETEWKIAKNYCDEYFKNFCIEKLAKTIKSHVSKIP